MNKLYEYMSFDKAKIIVETAENGGDLCMKGIFIQGNVRNQNQRIYPLHEITHAVKSINERVQGGESILGELDHPEELAINLDRVSHMITEMWMEGEDGCGKLKIIPTPMGNIVKTMLESGVKLGVSSRGSGNVEDGGSVSDFDIVTVDVVAQPSAPNAYPRSIYESLYNMKGGSQIHLLSQEALVDPEAQKYLQRDIIKFIQELQH